TRADQPQCWTFQDHPRVRGEHVAPNGKAVKKHGSSPRARGAHLMTSEYISPHRKTASLCASANQPAASASLRAVTSSRRPHELYLRLNFRRFSRRFHTASELMPEARLEPGGVHRLNEGAAPAVYSSETGSEPAGRRMSTTPS